MEQEFLKKLVEKHQETKIYPSTAATCNLITRLMLLLFPEQAKNKITDITDLSERFNHIKYLFTELLKQMEDELEGSAEDIAEAFFARIPTIYDTLLKDLNALERGDPAAQNTYEVIRTYPGFYAIAFFRMAHELCRLNVPLLPRAITEYAHSKTGIDIHPSAQIGPHFCIDHGTGIVIGGTTVIGEYVKIYQGVTLGALSVSKELARIKRHPTIEDNVVIYSGATILGGETVIGHDSIIGGNVWITKSMPAHSVVYHHEELKVKNQKQAASAK